MVERYDAVVIGGGHNGLVAAITLAEAGRTVLVCEASDRLGGAVASDPLTLPGFVHDTYSAVYPAAVASPVLARLPLARHGLEWVHPEVPLAHPFEDGRAAALHRDIDATAASLDALSPGDGRAWTALAGPLVEDIAALQEALLGGGLPAATALRILARRRLSGTLDLARLALAPAEAMAGELWQGAEARAWLYGTVLHADVPPREAGSALTGLALLLLGHAVGWPSPRGGAGRLAEALVAHLHELGGRTRTGAAVARIVVRRGRVAGVRLADGEGVRADTVIASLTPHQLLRLAGDALPAGYRRQLERYRYGPGTVKVDWALGAATPWRAAVARRAGTVHVGGSAEDIEHALRQRQDGLLPDRPFLLFGQQSVADPTRAPAGRHTAWAYTRVPDGVDWAREGERFADRIEAQVERFAPGFREHVLARHVLTPRDLGSGPHGGDVGGGSYALDQLVFRPVPRLVPYRTPVRGLYLGSASTFPGAAVHGVPGRAAARVALLEAPLRRLW